METRAAPGFREECTLARADVREPAILDEWRAQPWPSQQWGINLYDLTQTGRAPQRSGVPGSLPVNVPGWPALRANRSDKPEHTGSSLPLNRSNTSTEAEAEQLAPLAPR